MGDGHIEYLGFTTEGTRRQYLLRLMRPTGDHHEFTIAISLEAFASRRVRFQDAPDICFQKLQRDLASCSEGLPAAFQHISDAELEAYRFAHAPKPPVRRPKPPVVS